MDYGTKTDADNVECEGRGLESLFQARLLQQNHGPRLP